MFRVCADENSFSIVVLTHTPLEPTARRTTAALGSKETPECVYELDWLACVLPLDLSAICPVLSWLARLSVSVDTNLNNIA